MPLPVQMAAATLAFLGVTLGVQQAVLRARAGALQAA